jgi:hypothetical protein
MTTIKKFLLCALLFWAANATRASVATGDYAVSFGTNATLWDFSGSYTDSFGNGPIEYTINMDSSGVFTGVGAGSYSDDSGFLNFDVSLQGTARSSGNLVRVTVNLKMTGSGTIEGYDATFSATATERLELDPVGLQLIGTARGRGTVAVPGLGRQSAPIPTYDVQVPLPSDMSGTWGLALSVSTNQTKYSGTALATLSSGRSFPLTITGSYAPKTDASKLTLKGAGLNRAISLALLASVTNSQVTLHKLNGKALGQTLRMP